MPACSIASSTSSREVRVLELAGGDVDRDRQRLEAVGVQLGERLGRRAQDELAERADQAGLLRERDELRRARPRVQRTSASAPTSRPLPRSICGWKLTVSSLVLERRAQALLEVEPAQQPRAGRVAENSSTRSLPASLAWYIAVSASRSSTSASSSSGAATRQPMLTRTWRRWPAMSNGADSAPRMRPARIVAPVWSASRAQHGELVAADPGDEIAVVHGAAQALGDLDQQAVAGLVAEAVVDELEVVEVQEEHGQPLLRAHGRAQPGDERGAVRQPGQRIEARTGVEDEGRHAPPSVGRTQGSFKRLRTLGRRP